MNHFTGIDFFFKAHISGVCSVTTESVKLMSISFFYRLLFIWIGNHTYSWSRNAYSTFCVRARCVCVGRNRASPSGYNLYALMYAMLCDTVCVRVRCVLCGDLLLPFQITRIHVNETYARCSLGIDDNRHQWILWLDAYWGKYWLKVEWRTFGSEFFAFSSFKAIVKL